MTFPFPRGETYKKMWKNPWGKPTPHLFASYQAERLGAPPCLGARNLGWEETSKIWISPLAILENYHSNVYTLW